jgi:hypothetical protein
MVFGLLSLVLDVGWANYRKIGARAAAESAAIAGAMAASNYSLNCGSSAWVTCQAATDCPANPTSPPATNIDSACLYAKANGYRTYQKQTVTIAANTTSAPVSSLSPSYWVSATVTENLPQLFAGMLFFQDRNITLTGIKINGGSSIVLNGSLYFPTSDVQYAGGSNTINTYTALIAQHINFVGNSYFKADNTGTFNGLNTPTVAFIE